MGDVECRQCGTSFDPERDPEHYGSGNRCPYCGTEHVESEPDVDGAATVRITIEVFPEEGE